MAVELRPYQSEAIAAYRAALGNGLRRGVIALPTGTGKTVLGLSLGKQLAKRVLWLAHRDELIYQPVKTLRAIAPEIIPGVVKANKNEYRRDFVFASVQTAQNTKRLRNLQGFDLVVADECHHATAPSWRKVLEHVGCFRDGGPPLLGLTATPERTDNIALDAVFERIVYSLQLPEAVRRGYLVEPTFRYHKLNVDLSKVKVTGGDFNGGALDVALAEAGIVDAVCEAYDERADDRKTIIFTVSVQQAEAIAAKLRKRGVRAQPISGEMDLDLRRRRLREFAEDKVRVLVNCMVLTEGFDEPSVDCVIMARPTQSKSLYLQCIGRGLRLHPGKEDCLIVDMVGNSERHTLMQAPVLFGHPPHEKKSAECDNVSERTPEGAYEYQQNALTRQLEAHAEPTTRRALKWVKAANGFALSAGTGGTLIVRKADGDNYHVIVVAVPGEDAPLWLSTEPVSLELATGLAEDYVRRCEATRLVLASGAMASWRQQPATERQVEALRRWKVPTRAGLTKGEAADLLTQAIANDWRHEPATSKQRSALARMGVTCEPTMTKGQARKILSQRKQFG